MALCKYGLLAVVASLSQGNAHIVMVLDGDIMEDYVQDVEVMANALSVMELVDITRYNINETFLPLFWAFSRKMYIFAATL